MDEASVMKAAETAYSPDITGEQLEIDILAEKRLVRKLDFYIIPMVMLLYLFSFLDRCASACNLFQSI